MPGLKLGFLLLNLIACTHTHSHTLPSYFLFSPDSLLTFLSPLQSLGKLRQRTLRRMLAGRNLTLRSRPSAGAKMPCALPQFSAPCPESTLCVIQISTPGPERPQGYLLRWPSINDTFLGESHHNPAPVRDAALPPHSRPRTNYPTRSEPAARPPPRHYQAQRPVMAGFDPQSTTHCPLSPPWKKLLSGS